MLTPKNLLITLIAVTPLALFAGAPGDRQSAPSDRQIEETAKTSFTFRRVLNNDIDVTVRNGVATLRGSVRDPDQSRLAEDMVATIEGVTRVDNQIKLDPKAGGASDEWLAVKIRSKLLLDRSISLTPIKLDVKEGVVTLTGTAESPAQKARTELAIKEVVGVREVRNRLEVAEGTVDASPGRPEAERPESAVQASRLPTGREPPPTVERQLRSAVEDTAITTQIRFELLTNDETSGLAAKIDTRGGRVVITGEAASNAQRQLVTQLAQRVHGVEHVENRMVVKQP
jgi:hyperosmotically inducible periplasmic protein